MVFDVGKRTAEGFQGRLVYSDVSLGFGNGGGKIVDGISFEVLPGQKVMPMRPPPGASRKAICSGWVSLVLGFTGCFLRA